MDDYEMITRLGGGSFADVYKALEKSTGEFVAIKVLKRKYKKWEDCLDLREVSSLQKLQSDSLTNKPGSENIIKLKQIIFIKKTGELNLVFEYMDTDLLELMKSREPKQLSEDQIRDIMYQTLSGLAFMHKYGFFHRDMKPENILITGNRIKIADFGLAREIRSLPPYTEYVSTRYYRAPECILKSTNYNSPIDIWGLGCIMAEMYLHPHPLFCGSNEKEVLFRICSVLGTPTYDTWNEGIQQANILNLKFPSSPGTELEKIIKDASSEAIDLIKQMIQWDPNKRATAKNLLKHPFFTNHTINSYSYTEDKKDILFNENNIKKYSNIEQEKIIKINKEIIPLNNQIHKLDNAEKNFGFGDDDNNFDVLNDSDGFDKYVNNLKKQKIEEDKNYEKQKEKAKFNNFNYDDIDEDLIYSKEKKNIVINNNNIGKGSNGQNSQNVERNQNRRGNARQFLEETENDYHQSMNNNNVSKGNNFNFNNFGKSDIYDSFFGKGSRRKHEQNNDNDEI